MSLKIWLPLNGNLKDNGVNRVTATVSAAVTYGTGKVTAQSFSGGSTYIKFPWEDSKMNAFSIAMWVKPNTPAAWQDIFSFGNGNNRIEVDNTLTQYRWYANENPLITSGTVLFSLPNEQWNHIAMTLNGSKVYFYLNGVLVLTMTQACTFATAFGNLNELRLGCRTTTGTNLWKGYINDVRVYSHCLTPREIKQIAQGLVLHYKLNNDNNTNLLNQSYNFKNTATSIDPTYGFSVKSVDNSTGTSSKDFQSWSSIITAKYKDVYTLSFYAKSDNSTGLTTFLYNNTTGVQINNIKSSQGTGTSGDGNCRFKLSPQWQKCWVTYTFEGSRDNSTADLAKHLLFRALAGDKADIAMPKLERGAIATPYGLTYSESGSNVAIDCSGWSHHGATNGSMSFSSDSARYSNSCVFDGSTTGLDLPIKDLMKTVLSDKCTVNFWVNESDTSSRSIYFGGFSGSNFNIEQTDTSFRVYWNGNPDLTVGTVVNNEWAMWTVTVDIATGIKIYKDGVLIKTHAAALADIASGFTRDFNIGKDSRTDGTMMEGKMSDFRIYATVLSATDIKTLYDSSIMMGENGIIQAYEFNEEPDVFNIKMHKTGNLKSSDISEIGYIGGMKVKALSDGSAWARIHWLDVTTDKTWFKDSAEVAFCNKPNRFSRMGLVDHFKSYDLPKEYEALDYIASTGTQYIDTGYYWQSETVRVVMDAAITSNSSNQSLFGNEEPFSGGRYFSIVPHGNGGNFSFYVGSSTGLLGGSIALDTRFTMECSTSSDKKFTLKIQGTTVNTLSYGGTVMAYANTTSTHESKGKIYIFANHNSSTSGASPIQNIGGMKLYGFKMYDNNALVRDFIPCKHSNGTVGLYDKVFGVFYSSPNSAAFTAGPGATSSASKVDGIYEFMLTYPKLSATAFNRWTQASSPNANTVTGLKKITTAWNSHNGGIRKHGSACLYDCDTGTSWYSPIGQYSQWTDGKYIPAADGSSQTETELWVRIDNLPQLNKISMLDEEYLQALNIHEI